MSKISFTEDSEELLINLIDAYNDFKNDTLSKRYANECANISWNLTEWVFKNYKSTHNKNSLGEYRESLYPICPTLKIMHDIANGSKHYDLGRPKTKIKDAKQHDGDFNSDFSRDFDISILEIEFEDGTTLYFEDELEKVVEFWKSYFITTLNINL